MVQLAIDAHVHLYPNFDLHTAFTGAINNFAAWRSPVNSRSLLLLTERYDCQFFDRLESLASTIGFLFQRLPQREAVRITNPDQQELFLFSGRQIVTRESLEVCALACSIQIPDRQTPALEVIRRVQETGGIPALNWAPGKWLFQRGKVVAHLLQACRPEELLIGDTSMRPTFWAMPWLMRRARRLGFRMIAGSDPLPFAGEEKNLGRYGCCLQAEWQDDQPVSSLRHALLHSSHELERRGRRSSSLEFFRRQSRIMREKKNRT